MKNDSFFYSNLCDIVYSNMNKLKLTVFVVLMGWCMGSTAQKYTMSSNEFQLGLNLFENQKYSAAQQHFLAFLQSDASATREQTRNFIQRCAPCGCSTQTVSLR